MPLPYQGNNSEYQLNDQSFWKDAREGTVKNKAKHETDQNWKLVIRH